MNIINKTPYSFYFDMPNIGIVEIKPTEDACKVIYKTRSLIAVNGIAVNEKEPIEIINLPQVIKNTIYVVTPAVIAALDNLGRFSAKYERSDVFALDEDTCVNYENANFEWFGCKLNDFSFTRYYTSFISTDYFSDMVFYFKQYDNFKHFPRKN